MAESDWQPLDADVARPRRLDRCRGIHAVGVHAGWRTDMGGPREERPPRSGRHRHRRHIRGGQGGCAVRSIHAVGTMTRSSQGADAHRPYQEPVARLLDYGECKMAGGGPAELAWPNYTNDLGLTPEHVPELIRLACDASLHAADGESFAVWAPTHAWRALGQLRALEAVVPLLES